MKLANETSKLRVFLYFLFVLIYMYIFFLDDTKLMKSYWLLIIVGWVRSYSPDFSSYHVSITSLTCQSLSLKSKIGSWEVTGRSSAWISSWTASRLWQDMTPHFLPSIQWRREKEELIFMSIICCSCLCLCEGPPTPTLFVGRKWKVDVLSGQTDNGSETQTDPNCPAFSPCHPCAPRH